MQLSRRRFGQAAFAATLAGCSAPGSQDLLIHGGPIYTGVAAAPRVEALRISNGLIAFAGALDQARSGASRVREINLNGATAFPGFTDAHVHLTGVGMTSMRLDLTGVASIAAMQESLRTYAAAHPEGPIVGRGWIETHWPERRFPARADLDAVVGDRPVFLERIDGHAAVVNTAALALARIDANTADPDGGRIERDAGGAATGMLIDNATGLVERALPAPTPAMLRDALRAAGQLYASRGWVGICNMSTGADEAALFNDLAIAGEMPLRADLYLQPEAESYFASGQQIARDGRVRVRGVKLYMDGALGSRGAALLAPYSDMPSTSGLLVTPVEQLRDHLRLARERGYQIATHAIGDRGNRLVLDAYRDTFADAPNSLTAARWLIEHAQVIAPEDIPRFAQMGVIASMQPSHAISDLHFAPARLGSSRLAGAYAWRALLESGAVVAAGSDAPVEKGDPLIEYYAAAHRHDLSGFAGPDWGLDQAVSRADALKMLSWAPAYAVSEEESRGTLETGKAADISVFSVDLMEAEPAAIPAAQPVLTVSGGAITHESL
jgi:predicted amidohydrolase YtcJ